MESRAISEFWKKNKKLWPVIPLLLAGVILLLLGSGETGAEGDRSGETRDDTAAYAEALEQKAEALCAAVAGVGQVRVAITFAHGYEYVYAVDESYRGAVGGDSEYRSEYVINGKGDAQGMVFLTERLPEIAGVGVVCSGGGDAAVRDRIVLLLSSALGVSAHKIYVAEGNFR